MTSNNSNREASLLSKTKTWIVTSEWSSLEISTIVTQGLFGWFMLITSKSNGLAVISIGIVSIVLYRNYARFWKRVSPHSKQVQPTRQPSKTVQQVESYQKKETQQRAQNPEATSKQHEHSQPRENHSSSSPDENNQAKGENSDEADTIKDPDWSNSSNPSLNGDILEGVTPVKETIQDAIKEANETNGGSKSVLLFGKGTYDKGTFIREIDPNYPFSVQWSEISRTSPTYLREKPHDLDTTVIGVSREIEWLDTGQTEPGQSQANKRTRLNELTGFLQDLPDGAVFIGILNGEQVPPYIAEPFDEVVAVEHMSRIQRGAIIENALEECNQAIDEDSMGLLINWTLGMKPAEIEEAIGIAARKADINNRTIELHEVEKALIQIR